MDLRGSFLGFQEVFKRKNYIFLALAIALFFYILNVIILNWQTIVTLCSSISIFKKLDVFFYMVINLLGVITLASAIFLVIISVLIGIVFSMLVFKTKNSLEKIDSKNKATTFLGIFFGFLAPGCAACGLGILAFLGLGTATLSFFPYDGLELSILSVIILLYVVYKTGKIIKNNDSCSIVLKGGNKNGKTR